MKPQSILTFIIPAATVSLRRTLTKKLIRNASRAITLCVAVLATLSPLTATSKTDPHEVIANLQFENDYPTEETARILEDVLFFQRAVQVYHWALPAVNMFAMKEGTQKNFGAGYNVIAMFKGRIDANTLVTTPNTEVIYGFGFLDLAKDGPMVIDVPPNLQALIDDFWHRAIEGPTIDGHSYFADIGLPGPDKGKGGKYLVLPPHYEGEVPEEGYYVYRSRTNGVFVFLRGFYDSPDDLEKPIANMEKIRLFPFGKESTAKPMKFPNASGKPANMLAPADGGYFEMLDRFIQSEVVDPEDHYMRGMMATLGIVKGQPFEPDAHQKKLLDTAAHAAWKMAKVIAFETFDKLPKAKWYADRQWTSHPRGGGDDFYSSFDDFNYRAVDGGYTDLDAQVHMFINAYSMSPGMITSKPGVGSKYLEAAKDADGDFLVGDRSYTLTLPPDPPANNFWSIVVYDAKTAAALENGEPFPSRSSKDKPALEKNADGSFTLYFGPEAPAGKEKNWIKTVPGKGWFVLLRLYGPEKPFFEKNWIPGDFEKAK